MEATVEIESTMFSERMRESRMHTFDLALTLSAVVAPIFKIPNVFILCLRLCLCECGCECPYAFVLFVELSTTMSLLSCLRCHCHCCCLLIFIKFVCVPAQQRHICSR